MSIFPSESVSQKIQRLKAVRQTVGWSEEVCAHRLGVTYCTLNRWERGESLPKSRVVVDAIDRLLAEYEQAAGPHASSPKQNTGAGI